jgi:hypothetical protein
VRLAAQSDPSGEGTPPGALDRSDTPCFPLSRPRSLSVSIKYSSVLARIHSFRRALVTGLGRGLRRARGWQGTMSALHDGDTITLYADNDGSASATNGYLASDAMGHLGSTAEKVMLAPARKAASGEMNTVYPPAFQRRCLFRIDTGRRAEGSGSEIMYGQAFMLVHVDTDLCLTAVTSEDVELRPLDEDGVSGRRLPHSAYFFVFNPRYKLKTEGDRICARARRAHAPRAAARAPTPPRARLRSLARPHPPHH